MYVAWAYASWIGVSPDRVQYHRVSGYEVVKSLWEPWLTCIIRVNKQARSCISSSDRQRRRSNNFGHAQHALTTPHGFARTMELSRRDVIVAAVVGFIAWGWITHWFPTLRYLPYVFLTGCAVTTAGILYLILSVSRGTRYHAVEEVPRKRRNLAFVSPEAWKAETASLKSRSQYQREPSYPQSFVISNSVDGLLDLVLRDFVTSWYGKISARPTFTNEVDRAIRVALLNIRNKLLNVDVVGVVISRIVPIITAHMSDFYEAERTVRGRKLTRIVTESEELNLAIAGKYRDGKLHPAASLISSDTKLLEQQHLRSVVMRLLPKILPEAMTTSPSVSVLIQEIVACAVLSPVMQMLADPDTWNQLLEAYVCNHKKAAAFVTDAS